MTRFLMSWGLGLLLLPALAAGAGPRVAIVIDEKPAPLERRAADELAAQLKRLYQADAHVSDRIGADISHVIFVGNPQSNRQLIAFTDKWPKLSDQGHCLKSVIFRDRPALLVGGGSPAATYWAVSEFGHRLGIRSLLYGDLDPVAPPAFKLEGYDVALEPTLRTRTWRTVNDFPIGPESWGLEEQTLVIKQLAKQKYNRILISVYPWQPFVHFEFQGVKKQSSLLWYGWQYPVSGDTAGRSVFGGAKFFENPDFSGKVSYEDRRAAGEQLIRGIMDAAHQQGMSVGLLLSPLEFPKEFAQVLPQSKTVRGLEDLTIGPGAAQKPDDELLTKLTKAQLRAYVDTYPEVDALYLSLPEFPEWIEHADAAWKSLESRGLKGSLPSLANLVEQARNRSLIASQDRGERALRGNLVALDFLNRLRADTKLFQRADGRDIEVNFVQPDPALSSHIEKLVPAGTGVLHFVDYTARRVKENRELLAATPTKSVPSSLILTLNDDNVGFLPQSSHSSLQELLVELRNHGWSGFSTRYWCVGEIDLSAYLLSRGSFDSSISVEQACRDLVAPVCGDASAECTIKAMNLIEQATVLVDENDIAFSFPIPNVVMKHYASEEPIPEWWGKVREHYLNAMNEMYRANTRARDGGRSYTLYLARRCEFGFEYMNCVEAVRKAGIAKRSKDVATQRAQLEAAIESLNGGLNAMAAVARSNSDRGVIAVLNEYGYRPLVRELDAVDQAASKD